MTLESRLRQIQVFNLDHDAYCRQGDCACSEISTVVVEENPRTGERAPRRVAKKAPAALTLLARERRDGLPDAVLEVAAVQSAIACGQVRVVEQTPAAPSRTRPSRVGKEE